MVDNAQDEYWTKERLIALGVFVACGWPQRGEKGYALKAASPNPEVLRRLEDSFGGKVHKTSRGYLWVLTGKPFVEAFMGSVEKHLTKGQRRRWSGEKIPPSMVDDDNPHP